jgi:hypothetical protein
MEEVRGVRVFVMREGEGEGRACEKVNEGERGREERTTRLREVAGGEADRSGEEVRWWVCDGAYERDVNEYELM